MDFLTRINATLEGRDHDQIPFAPYDNLFPRGEFSRELRNRGMGLLIRLATVSEETPNVSSEVRYDGSIIKTTYHTPVGDITTHNRKHIRRISDDDILLDLDGMIKGIADYEPAIYIIDDTQFSLDPDVYYDATSDVGRDGFVRDVGMYPPYGISRYLFGGSSGLNLWSYEQFDHPSHFERLMDALIRREERRLELSIQSPAKLISFGDLDGTWSPENMIKYDLPLYKKWVPRFQSLGKKCALHAHALNLVLFQDFIADIGFDVIEAFTPPPIGNLPLAKAREAWGDKLVIWINFPETIFWQGFNKTKEYTRELIQSDAPGEALIIGFTEMGIWGGVYNDETEQIFKQGTVAVMEAIEEYGNLPVGGDKDLPDSR